MALPSSGALWTDLIADEVGYPTGATHYIGGPSLNSGAPGLTSLSYFYRPGNVATFGITQSVPFYMSSFYSQEALYRCTYFAPNGAATGSATIVSYYKNKQTIVLSGGGNFCVRQNYTGNMDITNIVNLTYSVGSVCSATNSLSIAATNSNYTQYGVLVYDIGGYDSNGNRTVPWAFSASTPNSNVGGGSAPNYGTGSYNQPFWTNNAANTSDGRMNRTALWYASNLNQLGQGFLSFGVYASTTKNYYIGIGADNYMNIKLNNVSLFTQSYTGDPSQFVPFTYWHIYPITFSAGNNTVIITNNNSSSVGAIGCEIYDTTLAGLTAAIVSGVAANTIFSSANFRNGGIFYQNLSSTCPATTTTTTTTLAPTTTSTTTTTTTLSLLAIQPGVNVYWYSSIPSGNNCTVGTTNYTSTVLYTKNGQFNNGGTVYTDSKGLSPFNGTIHPYWSDNSSCLFGTITAAGVFNDLFTCSICA